MSKRKQLLIIGYGSIGARHARIAQELNYEISIVSSKTNTPYTRFSSAQEALEAIQFEIVIICNPTSLHLSSLTEILRLDFKGKILVEKPIFNDVVDVKEMTLHQTYVAYNMRFHPCVQKVKTLLQNKKILSAQFYVGQHLSAWRPNIDYTDSYSSKRELGGGVLRDLSHEIDLVQFLCGKILQVCATVEKVSDLKIETEDLVVMQLKTDCNAIVSVEMNYFDRIHQRYFTINCEDLTVSVDLLNGKTRVNQLHSEEEFNRDISFKAQLMAIESNDLCVCDFNAGYEVVKCIKAIEESARSNAWVRV